MSLVHAQNASRNNVSLAEFLRQEVKGLERSFRVLDRKFSVILQQGGDAKKTGAERALVKRQLIAARADLAKASR